MITLLVVDMQVGLFEGHPPLYRAIQVAERINRLAAGLHAGGDAVVWIQQDGPAGSILETGTSGWQILPQLERQRADPVVTKPTNDSFYGTELETILSGFGSDQLIITGCATEFCVDSTVRAAISRNYQVSVAADAHTTRDRSHLDAASIIRHHNWVWGHMLTAQSRVQVRSTRALLENL